MSEEYVDRSWAIYEQQTRAGMDSALSRHGVDFGALEGNCGRGWCEHCFWHWSLHWTPGYVPVWYKPAPADLFSWAGVQ